MGLKLESKTIGEHTYDVRQLNAIQGRNVFLRFAKLVAPALESVMGGDMKDAEKTGITREKLFTALARVVQAASEEDLTYFCDVFAATTDVVSYGDDGKRKAPKLSTLFALHFAGDNLPDMFEWLYFCFEVNFGGFFAKLGVTRGTTGAPTTESK